MYKIDGLIDGCYLRWVFRIPSGQAVTCLHHESNLMVIPVAGGRASKILYLFPVRQRDKPTELLFTSRPVRKDRDRGSPKYGMILEAGADCPEEDILRQEYALDDPYIVMGSDSEGVGMALRLGLSEIGQEALPFTVPELLWCANSVEKATQGRYYRQSPTGTAPRGLVPPGMVPVKELPGDYGQHYGVPASRFTGGGVLAFNVGAFHGGWMHSPKPDAQQLSLTRGLIEIELQERDFQHVG